MCERRACNPSQVAGHALHLGGVAVQSLGFVWSRLQTAVVRDRALVPPFPLLEYKAGNWPAVAATNYRCGLQFLKSLDDSRTTGVGTGAPGPPFRRLQRHVMSRARQPRDCGRRQADLNIPNEKTDRQKTCCKKARTFGDRATFRQRDSSAGTIAKTGGPLGCSAARQAGARGSDPPSLGSRTGRT